MCVQLGNKDGSRVTMVMATLGQPPDRQQEISYTIVKVIGSGSFGVVYQARLQEDNEMVAIKKVLQDRRFKVTIWLFLVVMVTMFNMLESRITDNAKIRSY